MKFGVKILPKEVILDVQGRSVEHLLKENHFTLEKCRVGKYIEIEIPLSDEKAALDQLKKMTEFVLYNPLIETYEIQRLN